MIVLTGPTEVGKTKLSIRLAKAVDGEIISADSMQVYRHMDIGSAKISPDEMEGIPHHLIDVLEPDEEFNVVAFQRMAKSALEEICGRGRIPIIVGGTGFYIQALLYDVDFSRTDTDWTYRKELAEIGQKKGSAYLHSLLKEIDEKAAQEIHEHNQKRIIRALEYYHETGEKTVSYTHLDVYKRQVQLIAREVCAIHEGTVQTVLAETVSEHNPALITGRLSNNLLVHFPADQTIIGKLVDVELRECRGFYYMGDMV